MLAACCADPCYRDLNVSPAVTALQSMVRQTCMGCVTAACWPQLGSLDPAIRLLRSAARSNSELRPTQQSACLLIQLAIEGLHICYALLPVTVPTLRGPAQRRCQCPLEVIDAVRRTVRKVVECVDHEPDTMLVLQRRRSIGGSLGTAAKPNYKKALPLLRAAAALVRGLPVTDLPGVPKSFGAAVIEVVMRGC